MRLSRIRIATSLVRSIDMPRRVCWTSLVLLALAPLAAAQELTDSAASRGPRFLLAAALHPVPVDVSRTPVLRQRLALDLGDVPLKEALTAIAQQSGLDLVYSDDALPVGARVSLRAEGITVAAALTDVLADADLDVVFSRTGRAALVPRAKAGVLDSGSVRGRVTDAKSGQPIVRAGVALVGTRWQASTDENGQYRLAAVAAGTYTLTASRIGYAKKSQPVTVAAAQEVTVDLALGAAATELEQVVVTGTLVPTERKALPTPVSVINDSDIALQRPHTVQELFRQAVPTAVSWDFAAAPFQTAFSVRGASTFTPGIGQMKVFVDGVEAAVPSFAAVDPNSIERIEVVRGPQAAAIYGSDAIGGVVQIFTKRGDPSLTRPQVDVQAAVGVIQTPYAGFGGVLRQNYTAAVRGGGSDMSYNFGAGYSRIGDYLPNGEISRQSNPSAYGGIHSARGIIAVDVSARYYVENSPSVLNPAFQETGFLFFSKPFYQPSQNQNQMLGARISVEPTGWWSNVVTAGLDRFTNDQVTTQPRRTTSADTLLIVVNSSQTKTSIGFNTSVHGSIRSDLSGSLTAGFDHYSLPFTSFFTSGAVNTTGGIQTASGYSFSVSRTITNNTGYFAQGQLAFRDLLFLTGGLRAEQNTNFGDSLGAPVSPRVGLSYVREMGRMTLKLRGSYGKAIRPPSPGEKIGSQLASNVTLPNPVLGPERQKGWDGGADVAFGGHGFLGVTYYDQTADNLIQQVALPPTGSTPTYQYQNVGRVKNTGVEIEATLHAGLLRLKGQYGYARSRVEALPSGYSGDLRVGDQSLLTPKHTGGLSLTVVTHRGTTLAAGLAYVGAWNYYDVLAEFRCFGGTGPCQSTSRGYIVAYPSLFKANATVTQQITSTVWGFVSVDNLTNNDDYEQQNGAPVMGRVTTLGFQFHY